MFVFSDENRLFQRRKRSNPDIRRRQQRVAPADEQSPDLVLRGLFKNATSARNPTTNHAILAKLRL